METSTVGTRTRKLKNRRLKVLHIAGWYPSEKNPVAGIFIQEHVKATALYNDVVVLYSEGVSNAVKGIYEIQDDIENEIRTLRIRYKKSPVPKTTYFIYLWSMFAAFRKLIHDGFKPDLIHAHVYMAGVSALLIGKRYNIPVVVTEQFTGFPRGVVRGIERVKAKFAFERAAVVCPVSDDLRKHIEKLGIRAHFQVIPNVVDTSLFYPASKRSKKQSNDKKSLLTVALLTPKKGIPYLLESLSRLKRKRDDFVLDIVGDGPFRGKYEELARRLRIGDVVRFHGLKTKQEVAEFMRNADFFVLPSLFETFGAVIVEALACGKPVIATDIGGPNEIVKEHLGILVPPKNVEALAKAINYMLDHYQEYDPDKISEYTQSHYSHEVVGRQFYRLYCSILDGTYE